MNSVGIDLHRKRSHFAVIDDHGEVRMSRGVINSRESFTELLTGIDGELQIAVEATYGWKWVADLFEELGLELRLAHPTRTKAISAARVKTDAVDAKTLAHLLRTGLLPEAYVAPRELRDLRDLLRHRIALTQLRTGLKNRVRARLARLGIAREQSDLFGRAGREFLRTLELREPAHRRIDSTLSLIDDFDREITATAKEIDALARADDRVLVLCQIRGVGRYTAMLIMAEVGDVDRFPSARHLCSWAGLTPHVRNSDRTIRLGHITRRARSRCAGRSERPRKVPPRATARCAPASGRSANAAAARSPRSRPPARSSHSATTACATERSVA